MSPRPQIDHVRRPQLLEAAAGSSQNGASPRRESPTSPSGRARARRRFFTGSSRKDELLAEALTVEEERFYRQLTNRMQELESPSDKLRLMLESSAEEYDWTLWMEL